MARIDSMSVRFGKGKVNSHLVKYEMNSLSNHHANPMDGRFCKIIFVVNKYIERIHIFFGTTPFYRFLFVTVARKWVKVNCVRWVTKSLGKMNINVGKGVSEMINENGR